MTNHISKGLTVVIMLLVGTVVYSNVREQLSRDRSRLPEKVELSNGFQKWITNLKNKDFVIEADEFKLLEENEIYNTTRMVIYSMDDEDVQQVYKDTISAHQEVKYVVFSPSERSFIDYRHETRGDTESREFASNDARFYGVRDDKLIDSRILSCNLDANCFFDRAYFISNDLFVISEISRDVKRDEVIPTCKLTEKCTYTFKLHVIDLVNNSDLVYQSKPVDLVLADTIKEF